MGEIDTVLTETLTLTIRTGVTLIILFLIGYMLYLRPPRFQG